jgi:two-component system nitrate/nitrite response regulator NarL
MSEPIRVALIDDHGLCRRGLAELLELRAGIKVVGTTGNPDETIELLKTQKPDLAVMDLRMAPTDGLRVLQRLNEEAVGVPVVILTMSDSADDLAAALRLGARGYLLKDMEPQDVIDSIARAARGELVVAPVMAAKLSGLLQGGHQREQRENSLRQLTSREREILIHVARGLSNKSIARELGISHDTVKLHVRHILSKLNLVSRVEAAVFAIEHRDDIAGAAGESRQRVTAAR